MKALSEKEQERLAYFRSAYGPYRGLARRPIGGQRASANQIEEWDALVKRDYATNPIKIGRFPQ